MASGSESSTQRGGIAQYFVEHRGVGWLAMVAVLVTGWLAYQSLPQQEDPTFPTHDAMLVTIWPGATAAQVEQLVTKKIEDKLTELDCIEVSGSQSRANVSIVYVLQRAGSKAHILQEWDNMRAKLRDLSMPEGCGATTLDPDYQATATLLFAITSPQAGDAPRYNFRELEKVGETLENELKQLGSVGRIRMFGNVPEQIELRFSPAKLEEQQVAPEDIVKAIQSRNAVTPGGMFQEKGRSLPVQVSGEFHDEKDVEQLVVGLKLDGQPLRLRDVMEVKRGYEDPVPFSVDALHRDATGGMKQSRSVLLALEMKEGGKIADFDRSVRGVIGRARPALPEGVEIITLSDQPAQAAQRIAQFLRCFIEAVLVVVLVALFLMEWRSALIVAIAIPLTIAMTLGGMALLHVPLQQISIAALIISLGMLVDDPVVACDGINRELADGQPRGIASWLGPFKLRRAILFGTIINIVAFLPLALLPGDKGTFIVALPIVVTLALVSSRIVSVTFVPLLAFYLLRGQRGLEKRATSYKGLLQGALRHPLLTIIAAYGLLAASFGLTRFFSQQFFPPAERNQMLIDITLPDSASVSETRRVTSEVAEILKKHETITSAGIITGGTAPNFYYNVLPRVPAPWLAQAVINTRTAADVPPLVKQLRDELDASVKGARCVVKQLEQGPVIEAPIQIRISSNDISVLRAKADEVSQALRDAGGYHVHDDLGISAPVVRIDIDQDKASALGITTMQVGRVAQAAFYGIKVSEVREGAHAVPLVLRLREEERGDIAAINKLPIPTKDSGLVPLDQVATIRELPEQPVICHYNKLRTVTVKAFARFNELPSNALHRAKPVIDAIKLPAGCTLEYAGEAKELATSQREMTHVMLISLGLIALALLIQFGSVSKSLVVMLTVPLGLIGAFFGLAVTHAPFGFMSLLGIVSLAGVIVSHIIVLSDFIEEELAAGVELKEALVEAGLVRLRAVLVTVLATVCGLIPLALSGSELWRPLTAVHIFGLLFATLLTLLALPVLYYLFHRKRSTTSP